MPPIKARPSYSMAQSFFLLMTMTMVNQTLMPDNLHPNGLGSTEWGMAIVRKSLDLLGKPQPGPDALHDNSLTVKINGPFDSETNADENTGNPIGGNADDEALVTSCTRDFTSGQGWQDWKTAQNDTAQQQRVVWRRQMFL